MREAFLLQMNDFDLILELNLRQMLDPVGTRIGVIMMVLSSGRIGATRS